MGRFSFFSTQIDQILVHLRVIITSIRFVLFFGLTVIAICISPHVQADGLARWEKAWPVDAPLDIEWLSDFTHDGVRVRSLRFTGSVSGGTPQRVFALYAAPSSSGEDGRFPAMVQIHGGGQTCTPEKVAWFVKRGFACIAFDWGGEREGRSPEAVTQWGGTISRDYIDHPSGGSRDVFIFHAVLAARRAIDVLCQQPEVDSDRIGVQGISWGGLITWVTGALDGRIKALVPVYGVGGLELGRNDEGEALLRRGPAWVREWTETFDSRVFASSIKAPLLFCNGTNDWFGTLNASEEAMSVLSAPHARSYSANRSHGLGAGNVLAAMAWLDSYLKEGAHALPAEPVMELSASADGHLVVRVSAEAVDVQILLARGGLPDVLKCWLVVPTSESRRDEWVTEVPVWRVGEPVSLMAQASLQDGSILTSEVVLDLVPSSISGVTNGDDQLIASDVIAAAGDSCAWLAETSVDFSSVDLSAGQVFTVEAGDRLAVSAQKRGAPTFHEITTRRSADAAVRNGGGLSLAVWTYDLDSVDVFLNKTSRGFVGVESWHAKISPGSGWVKTILRPTDFSKNSNSSSLESFGSIYEISISGQSSDGGSAGVGELKWVSPMPEGR